MDILAGIKQLSKGVFERVARDYEMDNRWRAVPIHRPLRPPRAGWSGGDEEDCVVGTWIRLVSQSVVLWDRVELGWTRMEKGRLTARLIAAA